MTSKTTSEELERTLQRAAEASSALAETPRSTRAIYLDRVADALESEREALVATAHEETHLPLARLNAELTRTVFQARLFADELRRGLFLGATVDHADDGWPMGPRPDLRRATVPLGVVLVFAASNFPFAFSVFGGDSASALAAGCPVILKAHSYHPQLSLQTARVVIDALASAGAPVGAFAAIAGRDAGVAALRDDRVDAAGFTGSLHAGRMLHDIAATRPRPIPFFGELSSVNPVFVTRSAARSRPKVVATGLVASVTNGVGQFCTKPGIVFLPAESDLVAAVVEEARRVAPQPMLHPNIAESFHESVDAVSAQYGVEHRLRAEEREELMTGPEVLTTTSERFLVASDDLSRECFGPAVLLVTYENESELPGLAETFSGELTASLHAEPDDEIVGPLVRILRRRVGRLVWNGWPTGVTVSYAQQHGGPYPATTASSTTSVGMAAIERFLRPVAYQDWPEHLLPPELTDANPEGAPQRVDGEAHTTHTTDRSAR